MPIQGDFQRELRKGEEAKVDRLLQRAFGGQDEVRLVRKLRKSKAMAGETVVPAGDDLIGYYALSWMRSPKNWLCLAPVAVDPDWQGQGQGKRMMGLLSEWARLSGTYVVVLGEVGFYEKAGFSQARAANLQSPYPVEHTLIAGPGTDAPALELVYPAAFDGL
ncbi:GNAT family N-acetyltransferase [Thalassovita mangrovi]|uniref:GNAT family N-acetyltransferase n=1 Tax=Thalassovita mangrovi TaxID=2692236 RepID=A0A6L8LP96_9RHOB|nr:N-acetyltransferase [Thalassovita mangrovi]MYM54959.1 GNAT family N-acetyltransferase [Thalassovita mangrovi]